MVLITFCIVYLPVGLNAIALFYFVTAFKRLRKNNQNTDSATKGSFTNQKFCAVTGTRFENNNKVIKVVVMHFKKE